MPTKYTRDIITEELEWYHEGQALSPSCGEVNDDPYPDQLIISPPFPIVILIARQDGDTTPPFAAAKRKESASTTDYTSIVVVLLQSVKADFASRYDVVGQTEGNWNALSPAAEAKMQSILRQTRALKVEYHVGAHRARLDRGVSVTENSVCAHGNRAHRSMSHMDNVFTLVIHGAVRGTEWWICHQASGCTPLWSLQPRHLVLFGCPTPCLSAVHGIPNETLKCVEEVTFVIHPNEMPTNRPHFEPSWLSSLPHTGATIATLNIVFRPYRRSKTWEPMSVPKKTAAMFGKPPETRTPRRRLALDAILINLVTAILRLNALFPVDVVFIEAGSCPASLFDLVESHASPEQIQDAFEETFWEYLCDRINHESYPTSSAQKDKSEAIRQFIGPIMPYKDQRRQRIAEDIMSRVRFQSVEEYAKRAVAAGVFLRSEMDQWLSWPRPFERRYGKAKKRK